MMKRTRLFVDEFSMKDDTLARPTEFR